MTTLNAATLSHVFLQKKNKIKLFFLISFLTFVSLQFYTYHMKQLTNNAQRQRLVEIHACVKNEVANSQVTGWPMPLINGKSITLDAEERCATAFGESLITYQQKYPQQGMAYEQYINSQCIHKGIMYYREIGSYPFLRNGGREAIEVVRERCERSPGAFGQ